MEWEIVKKDDSKKQQEILKIMKDAEILPTEAEDGICFTLTLHTIEKFIRNLNAQDLAKRESFPVKYEKVFKHCLKTDEKWEKHCNELIGEFNKYHKQYSSGKEQKDIIEGTIKDCEFDVLLKNIRIEEHKEKASAAADLEKVLEGNGSVAILLSLNAEDEGGKSIGHTVALVRDNQTIYYLDVSNYMIRIPTATGREGKKNYKTSEILNEKILIDLEKRTIINVTYAVILP